MAASSSYQAAPGAADEVISGPWRATRLWNALVRTFHSGMPLRRHRQPFLRGGSVSLATGRLARVVAAGGKAAVVEDCFSGAEAVRWLHQQLVANPNFGEAVNEDQAARLLQKMLRAGFIEEAAGPAASASSSSSSLGASSSANMEDFEPQRLYRLGPAEGVARLRTPGKSTPGGLSSSAKAAKRAEMASLDNTYQQASPERPPALQPSRQKMPASLSATAVDKENLNRSYFQSLPPNSLILLDSEGVWKETYVTQLRATLGESAAARLHVDVATVMHNMTRLSPRGVVQLEVGDEGDLPSWVLSAMKTLANWPRPVRIANSDASSTVPANFYYPGFEYDVFCAVRDHFLEQPLPLVPYGLFDAFVERLGSNGANVANSHRLAALTSSLLAAPSQQQWERVARVRQTLEVSPRSNSSSSFETSMSSGMSECLPRPPPSGGLRKANEISCCFETAFTHENPVTRVLPGRQSLTGQGVRQPRWRRTSRRSISGWPEGHRSERPPSPARSESCAPSRAGLASQSILGQREYTSADDLLEPSFENSMIPSKTVRKEKRKQQARRERTASEDRGPTAYRSTRYGGLTVKTPIYDDPRSGGLAAGLDNSGMLRARAEPCRVDEDVGAIGRSYALLALLLPPAHRRRAQLLIKFIRRVSANPKLRLSRQRPNRAFLLETFAPALLRPYPHLVHCYGRRADSAAAAVAAFFVDHYDSVWLPPEPLRKEVEEKIYRSLVSKRVEAGEDPFPISYCRRVTAAAFERERSADGVRGALADLLAQIVDSKRLSDKEKRAQLKKFKNAHPDIYASIFPSEDSEPLYMRKAASAGNASFTRLPSIMRLRSAMRM